MWDDPAAHISQEFRQSFPDWASFRDYVQRQATSLDFGPDRALHQILSADFAARLAAVAEHSWVLLGSLSLPGRTLPGTWPQDFLPPEPSAIDPAYRVARSAYDLDLSALDLALPDPDEEARTYGPTIAASIGRIASREAGTLDETSLGLGGLVRYTIEGDLKTNPNVMGVISAQPLDPRYGPFTTVVADDPIAINIDIKPPRKVAPTTGVEIPTRPVVAFEIPGMAPYTPNNYPTVDQIADKISPLVGPPHALRPTPGGPWHRYKDLFDAFYLLNTCSIDAAAMRNAIDSNWNMRRLGLRELPQPYRLFGTYGDGPLIPWAQACDRMRESQPELRAYPPFEAMNRLLVEFSDGVVAAPDGARWQPGKGWTLPAPSSDPNSVTQIVAQALPQSARDRIRRPLSNLSTPQPPPTSTGQQPNLDPGK